MSPIEINQRKAKLQEIAVELKKHFVGIDNIIDNIINNIQAWYILPQLITRPVIINLWGLTGVGKTDLVRRLVKLLGFANLFVEVQLSNNLHKYSHSNLYSFLENSNLASGEPGILLLDEIQKFRTLNEDGYEIQDGGFQDVWDLLSDGKLWNSNDVKHFVLESMLDGAFDEDRKQNGEEAGDEEVFPCEKVGTNSKRKYHLSFWRSMKLKKMLNLKESVEEIMTWQFEKVQSVLTEALHNHHHQAYDGADFSKLLIFISGNLDEAFPMTKAVANVEVNADDYYYRTLEISLLDIKKALSRRFRAEQVARLGNCHVIYPSLNTNAYKEIIRRKLVEIATKIQDKCNIKVEIDDSVCEFIYRNGVVPAQGVRPLFSTITNVFENSMPNLLFHAVSNNLKHMKVYCKNKTIGFDSVMMPIPADFDDLRERNSADMDYQYVKAVHEIGHLINCLAVYNLVPKKVKINGAGDEEAFMDDVFFLKSRQETEKVAVVGLGGLAAEEVVFGSQNVTLGSKEDVNKVTKTLIDLYRNEGVYSCHRSKHVVITSEQANEYNNDTDTSGKIVESQMRKAFKQASSNIIKYKKIFVALVEKLVRCGELSQLHIQNIAKEFGIKAEIIEDNKGLCCRTKYGDKFQSFKA